MELKTLIVDDDMVVTFLNEAVVTESRLCEAPVTTANGKEALDYIANDVDQQGVNNKAKYLVLLDINMPVMNGWEFLDALKDTPYSDRVIVVLVTSSINTADHDKAKNYDHVVEYVEKPLTIETCKTLMKIPEICRFMDGQV